MAGSAVAVSLSAVALLCLLVYHLLPDKAAPVVVRAHRRAGGHHSMTSRRVAVPVHGPFLTEQELDQLLDRANHNRHGILAIGSFREALHRLPDWSHFDAELGPLSRYFGPDGLLDVRERLVYLFAILDRSPEDGRVSLAELEAWLRFLAVARLQAATRREMAKHDGNGDGVVTLREYMGVHHHNPMDWSGIHHSKPSGWGWLHKFASADADEDGSLNAEEFNDFLHPEDSSQEKVQLWLLKDKLSEMDQDGDGRLSLQEFVGQSHKFDINFVDHHQDGAEHQLARAEAEKKFRELDADMDNYLTVEEARPLIQCLITGEFSHATSHAKLLLKADDSRDGQLSLEEMLNDYASFYTTVYMDDHYDDGEVDAPDSHDEL